MNRRGFIKSISAFAALAISPSIPATEASQEHRRILELFKTGRVVGEKFYLDGPLILENINDVHILRCGFMCNFTGNDSAITIKSCRGLLFEECIFAVNNNHSLIRILE